MPDEVALNLLRRWRSFCFPQGEETASLVAGIRTTQAGEIRPSAGSRWMAFSATEYTGARHSEFRWEARVGAGKLSIISVTDAYEEGHGRLVVKAAGLVPLSRNTGPEMDKAELQRYLSSILLCPSILLNNPALEWAAVGPNRLGVRDRTDTSGAAVEFEIAEDGRPVACYAERPMIRGKRVITTPWSATCSEFIETHGFRTGRKVEVSWEVPEGPFTYFRSEIAAIEVLR